MILLNGPSGVGKTTVGRLLASRMSSGACVRVDALRDFVVSRNDDEAQHGLGAVNAAAVAANFVRHGYERVVVDAVFESSRDISRFIDAFDAEADLHVVTLWEATPLRSDQASWERMAGSLGELGDVVQTDGRTPDEVADAVETAIALA